MNAVPPGKHAQIGGRRVGVGADHEARAAIAEKAERLLLAGRLGMDVDDDGVGGLAQRARHQLAVGGGERIVERIHENAAHGIDHQHARAVLGLDHRRATARRAGGIIDRPDQFWRPLDENQRLLLVPGMIAERDRIGTSLDQLAIDRLRDAETAGRVLAIDHDQIELPFLDEPGQALNDHSPPAAADDVADEENAHTHLPRKSITSRSVSTRSRRSSRGVVGIFGTSWAAKAMPTAMTGFNARSRWMVIS